MVKYPTRAKQIVRPYFLFITAHPIPVLIVAAVLAGLSGACMFGLTRDTSADSFIPAGHPALALKRAVDAEFGLTDPIVLAVIREAEQGIFVPETLRLIQDLTLRIQQLPEVKAEDVISLATVSGVKFEDGLPGFEHLYAEIPPDRAGLDALRQDVLGYELYRGTLVAEDGTGACIIVRPPTGPGAVQADALYRTLRDLLSDLPLKDEQIFVAGEGAVQAHMGQAVSDDALRMNFLCPLFMFALIALAYRTMRGTILPLCVIGGASALALGSMALAGIPVFIVTNGIFVVIVALGVADSTHLLGQYYEEQLDLRGRSRRTLIVDACMVLWYPLLITSLTDVAGFFARVLVGGMPPIEYFGLFTCVGVLGALIYSYTVVPAGLAILPLRTSAAFQIRTAREGVGSDVIGRLMGAVGGFIFRHRRKVLILAGIVAAVGLLGASRVIVNDARILAFEERHPIARASAAINSRFDGTSQLNIVVTATESGALLRQEVLHKIEALEVFTESLPRVGGTHSLAGWVKRAHQKMHGEDPEFYAIPEDPSDTRFYLDTISGPTSPMAVQLREVVDPGYSRTNLIVRMRSSEYVHQHEVIGPIEAYLEANFPSPEFSTQLAGRVYLDYHWLRMIRGSHFRSVSFSLVCVLLLTALMFRSVRAGLLCTMTVGFAVLISYAVMGFSGIALGVGTSMFASISIGAGVNFPIHILDRLRQAGRAAGGGDEESLYRRTFMFTGRALFFTAFIVAAGFMLLFVSEFRTLVRFGLLIGLGMVLSFLASVSLLPALVATLDARRRRGQEQVQ